MTANGWIGTIGTI